MKLYITFFILLAIPCFVQSQVQKEGVDVVVLNSGKEYAGKIIQYTQGGTVVLRLPNGTEMEIPDDKIRKIRRNEWGIRNADDEKEEKYFRQTGLYNITSLGLSAGRRDGEALSVGTGVSNITGYRFSPYLGIGLGVGLHHYARGGETVYPVFAEYRSVFPGTGRSGKYYFAIQGGYGFAFSQERYGIRDASGGIMFCPAVGICTSTREGVDITLDAGIRWQKASFTKELGNGDVEISDYTYRRWTFRLGITLYGKKTSSEK